MWKCGIEALTNFCTGDIWYPCETNYWSNDEVVKYSSMVTLCGDLQYSWAGYSVTFIERKSAAVGDNSIVLLHLILK